MYAVCLCIGSEDAVVAARYPCGVTWAAHLNDSQPLVDAEIHDVSSESEEHDEALIEAEVGAAAEVDTTVEACFDTLQGIVDGDSPEMGTETPDDEELEFAFRVLRRIASD